GDVLVSNPHRQVGTKPLEGRPRPLARRPGFEKLGKVQNGLLLFGREPAERFQNGLFHGHGWWSRSTLRYLYRFPSSIVYVHGKMLLPYPDCGPLIGQRPPPPRSPDHGRTQGLRRRPPHPPAGFTPRRPPALGRRVAATIPPGPR